MFLIGVLAGLVLLVVGAELLVRGGGRLALALRIPALVVGLTVVAFGTSAPELAVSMTAALRASTEMALANVNGSNIANIALVLGLAALVAPIRVDRGLFRREIPVLLVLQLLVVLFCYDGVISRIEGAVLLGLGLLYNGWIVREAWVRRHIVTEEDLDLPPLVPGHWSRHALLLVLGLGILVVGAQLFVAGAVELAHLFGLSDRTIGLTVIALGTSAPEIATGVVAAYRKQSDLVTGNVLGSNILNITMVLALTALVLPIEVHDTGSMLDLGVAFGVTLLLLPMILRDRRISRGEGALLATGYVAYLLLLAS